MIRKPTSHVQLTLPGDAFEDVVELASQWVRGVPPFQKYRGSRRRAGLPDDMDAGELRSDTWLEDGDLLLRAYGDDEVWAVQFRHPQKNRPDVVWETVLLVDRTSGQTELTQLTTRTSKRGSYMASRAALVTALVERHQGLLEDQLLAGKPDVLWNPASVDAYVRTILNAPTRTVPVVVVSRRRGRDPVAVDPVELARCMVGSALVVELSNARVAYAWSNALEALGFEPTLGCFNGAVRQYLPDLQANLRRGRHSGHRLFLYDRAQRIGIKHRIETVAGAFLDDSVGPKVPEILDRVWAYLDEEE